MKVFRAGSLAALSGCLLGTSLSCAERAPAGNGQPPAVPIDPGATGMAGPQRLVDPAGLHNVWLVASGPRGPVYSGSGPDSADAFDALARLGVRTVLSVDAAAPRLDLAAPRGMRYVHVPIQYSGVHAGAAEAIALALIDLPRPIYIHCHHGKHRGPAAAMVGLVCAGEIDPADTRAILADAGTSLSYPGLYAAAADAEPLPFHELTTLRQRVGELPAVAPVGTDAALMAALDGHFENLNLIEAAGWTTPPDHPDLVPAAEAGAAHDLLRRWQAEPANASKPQDFLATLARSIAEAGRLEAMLVAAAETRATPGAAAPEPLDTPAASAALERLGQSCIACHQRYRNG